MTISLTTTLSKPIGADRIPKGTVGYFRARNRHRLYSLIIKEFKESGLTQADLARRLGKTPDIVCRLLATPGNIQTDTLSDLLFAISGAVPSYGTDYPLELPVRNDNRPDWLIYPLTDRYVASVPEQSGLHTAKSAKDANEKDAKSAQSKRMTAETAKVINPAVAHRSSTTWPSQSVMEARG